MKIKSIVAANLSTTLMAVALPVQAGLPSTTETPENETGKQSRDYVLTNAKTLVAGCTQEALEGPNKLHSAYITGRLAIHESDKHKIQNANDLRNMLDKFEVILKDAWTTKGSLNLSYKQFGSFEEAPKTGNPVFNAKFNVRPEAQKRIELATQSAENTFAQQHDIAVDVKSVRFERLEPGCGL